MLKITNENALLKYYLFLQSYKVQNQIIIKIELI